MGEHFLPGCCVPLRTLILREIRNWLLALLGSPDLYGGGGLVIERILFLEALYRANPSAALRRQARAWFDKYEKEEQ